VGQVTAAVEAKLAMPAVPPVEPALTVLALAVPGPVVLALVVLALVVLAAAVLPSVVPGPMGSLAAKAQARSDRFVGLIRTPSLPAMAVAATRVALHA
jgi:hypothetical protein